MPRPRLATALTLSILAWSAGAALAGEAPGPLADARLMQITLPVKDLDRAVAFYQGVLGVRLLFRVPGAAFLDAGGVRLRLERSDTPAPTGAVELYFDDPGLARAKPLADRGVRFVGPPETVQRLAKTDVQLLEFTDPDGNALALMGEVARR
ncbi:VOC family protein [Phenylobacterium sp.]|jgi:catechol 2,3-dioxygenase-like lactoylglutathione lyase family enzyme|uniref:VOC family protein n=1 Tax=Phenylobacterium sp. TaxID=1871053 RepID=UPI002F3EF3FD